MSNEEIRALLELEAKATPPPWEFNSYSAVQTREREICFVPAEHGDQSTGVDNANGWLIPVARNNFRPLAEEVLALREQVAKLERAADDATQKALEAMMAGSEAITENAQLQGAVERCIEIAEEVADSDDKEDAASRRGAGAVAALIRREFQLVTEDQPR